MQSDLFSWFPLRPARVHEVTGPGAITFAALMVARSSGHVLWLREAWESQVLSPVGLSRFFDPARLLMAQVKDQTECLATAEEALRDGACPLVVMELNQPLDLTKGRRLQLAAKTGKSTGLCLIPVDMGSNAAQTRWHCTPVFDPSSAPADSTLQAWSLIKNKSGTLGAWHVRWDAASRHLDVVSPAGKRPGSAVAPD